VVADAALVEGPRVVLGLVEPHHGRHAEVAREDVGVGDGAEAAVAAAVVAVLLAAEVLRAPERDGAARHHLVEVAVARVGVVPVLDVDGAPELAVVGCAQPPEYHALLDASPAVLQAQAEVGGGVGGVSEGLYIDLVNPVEALRCLGCTFLCWTIIIYAPRRKTAFVKDRVPSDITL
jgi:hypothetical protein